jgi:hypothetical protein
MSTEASAPSTFLSNEYFTENELATALTKSQRTLKRWRERRIGPAPTFIGKNVFYRKDAVRQWLLRQERKQVRAVKPRSRRRVA